MSVTLRVHFGNNNWFTLNLTERTQFYSIYEHFSVITAIPVAKILYVICNGHIVDKTDKDYGFDKYVQDIPNLHLQDNIVSVHVITINEQVPEDRFDQIIKHQYSQLARRTLPLTSLPTIIEMTEAFIGLPQDFNYEQAITLQNVPVVLDQGAYQQYTTSVSHGDSSDCICGTTLSYEETEPLVSLPCGHIFHDACIREQLMSINTRCPLCNHDVREGTRTV